MQIDIYSDPRLYDAAHVWKTNDIEFITNYATQQRGLILEMASGTGRLSAPLIDKGLNYTGVELSKPFVEYTRKKLKAYNTNHSIIQGDMKNISLDKKYNFIFIAFNSICHLLTNKDLLKFFKCVHNHLINQYNPSTQINHIKWLFESSTVDEFLFDMHMIYPDTMDRLLTDSGFIIKKKFGDYEKSPFSSESHLQIYLCTK